MKQSIGRFSESELSRENLYELSDVEKEDIHRAVTVIKKGYGITDRERQALRDAQQTIIGYGHRALPFLAEELSESPHEYFQFSLFADAISQEEDLDFFLENINKANALTITDGSSASHLTRSILRILRDIRERNPQDIRLQQASQKLIELLAIPGLNSGSAKSGLLAALSTTGTEEAKRYVTAYVNSQDNIFARQRDYLIDSSKLQELYVGRHRFESWDEVQASRIRYEHHESGGMEGNSKDDLDWSFDGLDENDDENDHYDSGELTNQAIVAIGKTNELIMQSSHFEETAIPAIKLHMFNYFLHNPDAREDDLQAELSRMSRISDMEKTAGMETNPLPTVGIEVEIFSDNQEDSKEILNGLDIPNYWEYDGSLEVNPNFSYAAITQARILQELTSMGAIPLEKKQGEKYAHIPDGDMLSLHVNFGLPKEIKGDLRFYEQDLYRMNDLITAAFTSPHRLAGRKTSNSISWEKQADESKKYKKENGSPRATDPTPSQYARLELRALEFRDYPSYRMLVESQRLIAMLIAYIKTMETIGASTVEKDLSILYGDFFQEVTTYFADIDFTTNLADTSKGALIRLMESTNLKEKSRSIISRYSRQIAEILKNKEVET